MRTKVMRVGWRIEADDDFPEGKLDLAVMIVGERPIVQAAYVTIEGRGERSAKTKRFDDGVLAVDYDDRGRVRGVELLALHPASGFKQFVRSLARPGPERNLIWTAAAKAIQAWDHFEVAAMVLATAEKTRNDAATVSRRAQGALKKRRSERQWPSTPRELIAAAQTA